jgi:hypothetical protein
VHMPLLLMEQGLYFFERRLEIRYYLLNFVVSSFKL